MRCRAWYQPGEHPRVLHRDVARRRTSAFNSRTPRTSEINRLDTVVSKCRRINVRAGLGLAVVPAQTIELELQAGCLAVLSVEGFPIVRQWFVAHRTQKRLSAAANAFRDMLLAQELSSEPQAARPVLASEPAGLFVLST